MPWQSSVRAVRVRLLIIRDVFGHKGCLLSPRLFDLAFFCDHSMDDAICHNVLYKRHFCWSALAALVGVLQGAVLIRLHQLQLWGGMPGGCYRRLYRPRTWPTSRSAASNQGGAHTMLWWAEVEVAGVVCWRVYMTTFSRQCVPSSIETAIYVFVRATKMNRAHQTSLVLTMYTYRSASMLHSSGCCCSLYLFQTTPSPITPHYLTSGGCNNQNCSDTTRPPCQVDSLP